MYVCVCNRVTDTQILNACSQGANSMECLQSSLKVATCCGRCEDCARKLLHESMSISMTPEISPAMA